MLTDVKRVLYRLRLCGTASLVTIVLLVGGGCRSGGGGKLVGRWRAGSGNAAHLKIENRAAETERIVVRIDNRTVYDDRLPPRGVATPPPVELSRGWHRIGTSGSSGATHQAVVRGDQEQWLLIRRDPLKPEGFGIHVTGRPN